MGKCAKLGMSLVRGGIWSKIRPDGADAVKGHIHAGRLSLIRGDVTMLYDREVPENDHYLYLIQLKLSIRICGHHY